MENGNEVWKNGNIIILSHYMNESFKRWTDQYLIEPAPDPEEFSRRLYFAPFVVFGVNNHPNPVFNYANDSSQKLFSYTWQEFTQLPANHPIDQRDPYSNQRILEECSTRGYSKSYESISLTSTGQRFKPGKTILWNVLDDSGRKLGKALVFNKWKFL